MHPSAILPEALGEQSMSHPQSWGWDWLQLDTAGHRPLALAIAVVYLSLPTCREFETWASNGCFEPRRKCQVCWEGKLVNRV